MRNRWFSFNQHTTNSKGSVIGSEKIINILGYTGGNSSSLTTKMKSALRAAISDCNTLHPDFSFQLTFGANYQPNDIVVYRVANDLPGAKVGLPEGDRPHKWIQINSGIDELKDNVIEYVMSREIRHSMGLKRKNGFWRLRKAVKPVQEEVAIANFDSEEDAEFDFYDRVVREYLY